MAQVVDDAGKIQASKGFLFSPHWSYQKLSGDWTDRFYDFNSIGISVLYKTKSNFQFGLDYDWFFGDKVRDSSIFFGITGPSGFIIDQNGDFSVIRMRVKGNYVTGNFGYLWAFEPSMPNSGLFFSVGAGVLQHKIDIFSSQVTIPQINDEYEAGYDRLAYGFASKQYVGYQYLVSHNKFHFRAGIEFNQGFIQGRRTWNYSTNSPGTEKRIDQSLAFKFGIIVPVYTKDAADEEFFID